MKGGEERGFEEIYQLYFKDSVSLRAQSLGRRGVAEEVTQETFFKALKAIDSYDGRQRHSRLAVYDRAQHLFIRLRKQKPMSDEPLPEFASPQRDFTLQFVDEERALLIHRFLHE